MGSGTRRPWRWALRGMLVAQAACATSPQAEPDPAVLTTADRTLGREVEARGPVALLEAFREDGVLVTSGVVVGPGVAAIRAYLAPAHADSAFTMSWTPSYGRIAASGDVGYTVGTFHGRREGEPIVGSYVTIWRKQAGVWGVELVSWTDWP